MIMFLEENPHGPKKVFQYTAVIQYNDQGDALAIQESTTRKGKFKSSIPKSHSESLRLKENKKMGCYSPYKAVPGFVKSS